MRSEINKIEAEQANKIPTLADLALKYGTISKDQHDYLIKLFAFKKERVDFEGLLRDEGMATQYQLSLLKLIREYQIIRKIGEEFGKIAIDKGLASKVDINQALELQKKEFKKSRHKKLIGDILVEARILTTKQKDLILKEQALFNKYDYDLSRDKSKLYEVEEEGGGQNEGKQSEINIIVSSDRMAAWMKIDSHDGNSISLNQIKDTIRADGIVNGVYSDAVIQCFLEAGIKKFPIARVDCYNFLLSQNNFSLYINAADGNPLEKKKGEVLVEQNDTVIDVQIEDVYGETANAEQGNDFPVSCGENTRWSRNKRKILSAKSGKSTLSAARKVIVHPEVHVLEDADYRYGPIDPYADLSVSGTITGAYIVTAGNLSAGEIRGASIDAIGDIHIRVGITDAKIRAEGDVYARYVHNSNIETFGNVYVQNEIIDGQIKCGGKFESPKCRVISSTIYAKGGVVLLGVGSERSKPSKIVAGSEHHAIALSVKILDKINSVYSKLEVLKAEKEDHEFQAGKIFQKMIKLKTFHDKARKKKDVLLSELDNKKKHIKENILTNIQKLISSYDKRLNSSLASLKAMNAAKKEHDTCVQELENKIAISAALAEKEILSHEKTLFAYLEKSKEKNGVSNIEIKGKAYAGTMVGGVYQALLLSDDRNGLKVKEAFGKGRFPELQITQPRHKS